MRGPTFSNFGPYGISIHDLEERRGVPLGQVRARTSFSRPLTVKASDARHRARRKEAKA